MYSVYPKEENQGRRTAKQKEKKNLQVKKSVLMLREKAEWRGLKTTYWKDLLTWKKMSQNNQHQYITAVRKRAFGHSCKDKKKKLSHLERKPDWPQTVTAMLYARRQWNDTHSRKNFTVSKPAFKKRYQQTFKHSRTQIILLS